MTTTKTGFRPRTADTLPRRPEREGDRSRWHGALALVGILLLVVGVPAVLVAFVGNPLPTSLPDRSWLEADLTAAAVIRVFAVLVWLVWAHFVVCLIAELQAARRGRMPGMVPFGGGTQMVARRLVAGVLLLVGTATMSGTVPTGAGPADTSVVSTREVGGAGATGATAGTVGSTTVSTAGASTGMPRMLQGALGGVADGVTGFVGAAGGDAVARAGSAPVLKYYEVQPPQGRNYDTLWDIADRTLGDPFRYKEIFELNQDRVQPDGRRLVDADLIHPGWNLVLPADATGADVRALTVGTPAPSGATPATDGPSGASTTGRSAADAVGAAVDGRRAVGALTGAADGSSTVADPARPTGQGAAQAGSVTPQDAAGDGSLTPQDAPDLSELLTGGGLVLAGVLLALSTRRSDYGTPGPAEEALRLAANPDRAALLDRALRLLSEGRRSQREAMPDAVAVYVNDDQVVVHVAGSPAPPPTPWTVVESGRAWTVHRADLEGLSSTAPAPWPALVAVAESHGYDLLVDLEHAPGLVSLAGHAETARQVVLSTVVDLVTHPWSDGVSVTMVGFGTDLRDVAPSRITQMPTIEEALAQGARTTEHCRRLLRQLGVDGVLAGRVADAGADLRPRVLVLSGPPSPEQARSLAEHIHDGRSLLTVVCVGNTPAARWRFVVDQGGAIDLGVLGLSGTARRLTTQGLDLVRDLFRDAVDEAAQRATEVAAQRPSSLLRRSEGQRSAATLAPPTRTPVAPDQALAQVRLLGPVAVSAAGSVEPAREPLLTELVCVVALHPAGVHESVLQVALWPRGVEDDVLAATLRAAQRWLGEDASGRPLLRQEDDGRWHLAPEVDVDWVRFVAHAAHDDDRLELSAALSLAQGPAFSATPPGRYGWLAFHLAARDCRALVTATARRAADLHLAGGDPDGAVRTLRQGLVLAPTAQPLWRDLVRLLGDRDPGGAGAAIEELREHLLERAWEPETTALVRHLRPDDRIIS